MFYEMLSLIDIPEQVFQQSVQQIMLVVSEKVDIFQGRYSSSYIVELIKSRNIDVNSKVHHFKMEQYIPYSLI